jgi:DnaJ-class molecular chaperone
MDIAKLEKIISDLYQKIDDLTKSVEKLQKNSIGNEKIGPGYWHSEPRFKPSPPSDDQVNEALQKLYEIVRPAISEQKNCLHLNCGECHGTGIKRGGGACIHSISCNCPQCTPYAMITGQLQGHSAVKEEICKTCEGFGFAEAEGFGYTCSPCQGTGRNLK